MNDLLDRAPCGFLSFGDDGIVQLANTTLLELLGYDAAEVVGSHVERILTVGTRIFYQTHWFPLLRLHQRADEIFLMLRSKAGEDIGVLANAVHRDRDGGPAYDCVLMPVRERQKYEDELLRAKRAAEQARAELHVINDQLLERTEELELARAAAEEANEAKSTFLAVMSHELRTPLNAISGYVELLEIGIYGAINAEQKDALDRINRSQRHLLRLINDVLNLARIEAGHVDYAVTDVTVERLIDEVRPMVEPQLAAKELRFELAVAADLAVHADAEKVQQILLNLLTNAIKFTPTGGRVTLEAAAHSDAADVVSISVADTGIGIAPEKLDTVFEPFVQVDVTQKGRTQGTGLGLAISRDLARGMGGDVSAVSAEGHGSTFTLTLPRAPTP